MSDNENGKENGKLTCKCVFVDIGTASATGTRGSSTASASASATANVGDKVRAGGSVLFGMGMGLVFWF